MNPKAQLTVLYNTLVTIETKGASTETMADCLRYLKRLINDMPDMGEPVDGEEPVTESDT